ncbi:hypothetical protein V2P20_09000 [Methylobacter sp. Wu1]|uniref:hypothetical protein n=1 Tax=Methylobacter sp. Wu1 TaxID=3119359 RepID=UPI002F92E938
MGPEYATDGPAKSVNLCPHAIGTNQNKLLDIRQWHDFLQSVLVMLHIAMIIAAKSLLLYLISVFIFRPVNKLIAKMPDSKLKRLLLTHIYE